MISSQITYPHSLKIKPILTVYANMSKLPPLILVISALLLLLLHNLVNKYDIISSLM